MWNRSLLDLDMRGCAAFIAYSDTAILDAIVI